MPTPDDKVIHPFPTIEERAAKAMADYKSGVADESAGKGRAIRAVIEYGRALTEGKRDGEENRHNTSFGQWVTDNGLDLGKPWDSKQERSCAMKIAALLGSVPNTSFDACPNTRPTHIMKWYRKMHAPKTDRESNKPQAQTQAPEPEPAATAQQKGRSHRVDAAYNAIVNWVKSGKELPTQDELAEAIGAKRLTVRMALERWNAEQNLSTKSKINEDGALAKAEAVFSDKAKLTIADAIRIHKARLEKNFEQLVSEEVRKRIATADNAVRERLKKADAAILQFERERGKKGVFTKRQFKQLQICCHPDASASPETRAELLQILVKYETYLVNPEMKDV